MNRLSPNATRLSTVLVMLVSLLSLSALGQDCSPGSGMFFAEGGTVGVALGGVSVATFQTAVGMWSNACGNVLGGEYNLAFPEIALGGGDVSIGVTYYSGTSPYGCGLFEPDLSPPIPSRGYARRLIGGGIGVWQYDMWGNPCNVALTLAHEFGHVLGLSDSSGVQGCGAHIMGGGSLIAEAACLNAGLVWATPQESVGEDQLWCDGHFINVDPVCGLDCACYTPIILDLDRNGLALSGPEATVLFDLGGHGRYVEMTWVAAGSADAFLWRDRNGDGKVNNGLELFGTGAPLPDSSIALQGFELLEAFDAAEAGGNQDGWISAEDQVWPKLMLWLDLDADGQSTPAEVSTLAQQGILAIDLDWKTVGKHDHNGNYLRYWSFFDLLEEAATVKKHKAWDVIFAIIAQ